ncbi:MAG: acetyl-CoA carboxylase biotin carboxylase subunit [Candidatus Neomarinimicrobiota bacterium]
MLKKVLIANRGEIALRIIRSCRELDIPTVAVYSDADRTAPHVLQADQAVHIGPAPSAESYLNIERILNAARSSGAHAIHPGYGFLSENARFAEAVIAAGFIWIGPEPATLARMGDKVAARTLALEIGMPVVPGSDEPLGDPDAAAAIAGELGYPVLIKAAGGGGGKGMRSVDSAAELPAAFERARSEAAAAFSDDRVYVEQVIHRPHHVEVQLFADRHGHVVTLGERECSIQRRYQKIIEESPSPIVTNDLREQLAGLAAQLAAACDYVGAGTVEFLVDRERNFYFLEMNTRLQVEHPVTELVTGLDLVAEQLRVAAGEPLSFAQQDIHPKGHAIECRIYAEDGFNRFIPSTGTVRELELPGGPGVRLDFGLRAGQQVSHHYDPLLGKLSVWGADRSQALSRMTRALEELRIEGLATTAPLCLAVVHHPAFQNGETDTGFIAEHGQELAAWAEGRSDSQDEAAAIGAALFAARQEIQPATPAQARHADSTWLRLGRDRQVSR